MTTKIIITKETSFWLELTGGNKVELTEEEARSLYKTLVAHFGHEVDPVPRYGKPITYWPPLPPTTGSPDYCINTYSTIYAESKL